MQKQTTTLGFLGLLALMGALFTTGCDDGTDGEGGAGAGGDSASGGGTGEAGASNSTGGSSSAANDCTGLCEAAGYDSGEELLFDGFPGGECSCAGGGEDLSQEACNDYCDTFDVPPAYSYLSSVNDDGAQDKCVCDGSQL